jgi:isocitrate/isopropylmalate dehydrogenase
LIVNGLSPECMKCLGGKRMKAIEFVCAAGTVTPDVGGNATTRMVTDVVIEAILGSNA